MKLVSAFNRAMNTQVLACVFVLVLLALFIVPSQSTALTVTPRIEINANPGSLVTTAVKVSNEELASRTMYLRYENFNAEDESGTPRFSSRSEGLATWMDSAEQITVGPGETVEVPLTINIPGDAEPGGHFAAIFFLDQPAPEDAGEVAITSKLGSLVLLRVAGDFEQNADILEFNTIDKRTLWNQLPVGFYYRFQNVGDDHLKPLGDVQIKNTFGRLVKILPANTVDGSVLPSSVRRFTSVWTQNRGPLKQDPISEMPKVEQLKFWDAAKYQIRHFTFGRYTADLKLAFGTKELKSDSARVVFYIIPWQLLSVAIPTLLILAILGRFGIKRYNRYIIGKAQAERASGKRPTKSKK